MKNFVFLIIIGLFIGAANASSRISTCRQASDRYKSLSVHYDKFFQSALNEVGEKRSEYFKKIIEFHEDYKDAEYKRLLEYSRKLVRNEGFSPDGAEAWRYFMEASIDIAFVSAGDNMKAGSLGKSEDHYARKIYDSCMGFK